MKIGISLKQNAYTPEAYAYQEYLIARGHSIQLDYEHLLDNNNDINIYFMGVRPFWKKKRIKAIEVHEYQSLSTPPYAILKDIVKKTINSKPSGRIFLNEEVENTLQFKDSIPSIRRDMGVDEALYQQKSDNPIYDIVYCGSILGRQGLVEAIIQLANLDLKILIIGTVTSEIEQIFKLSQKNITLLGRVERSELPKLYRECRFGLNFTPDIYPFNIQTSTKTLEYLASGLSVISNKYQWIEEFALNHDYQPIWLESISSKDDLISNINNDVQVDMHIYKWGNILENSGFENFLLKLV
ncbi:glycosyltransferase [Acinetobacter sp. yr461]|uniref:glycosyltransferase n=1 Tax=Acinetobacter sp. yr461 TaxID=1761742 RepID=UPI0008B8F4E6|nr:glycosyltransferase [Acinetobacter sp. yr461]SEO84347.1 Glycosyl transferases group 1 [Acinetobacter sp. yr461]